MEYFTERDAILILLKTAHIRTQQKAEAMVHNPREQELLWSECIGIERAIALVENMEIVIKPGVNND